MKRTSLSSYLTRALAEARLLNMVKKVRKFPAKINGIIYKTEQEYNERLQSDIDAFANLLFDIYKDKKKLEIQKNAKD